MENNLEMSGFSKGDIERLKKLWNKMEGNDTNSNPCLDIGDQSEAANLNLRTTNVLLGIHSNPSKIDLIAFLLVSFCTTSLSLPNRCSCEKRLLAGTITISKPHLECKRYTTRKRS
ncbi:Uncharacterized protein Fot_06936 [Forsythia ovata]|uniref:Uncharacterized protein n=1 Tax=Forsythia ovata TaxID=205694 RepID=A0ABD1WUD1_9LAMI